VQSISVCFCSLRVWSEGVEVCIQDGDSFLLRALVSSRQYTVGQHDGPR